ncbi:MAG: hypothetical protein ACOC7N_06070 [Chloroflexota bacterium]
MQWFDNPVTAGAKYLLTDISVFSRLVVQRPLRTYQLEPARAILRSILNGHGTEFAIVMSRQAGKNEMAAQLEAYLLNLYQRRGGQIVKASPTFKPQTVNSMLRLEEHLNNDWNQALWRRREGYIFQLHNARCLFFSAEPTASVVGGTASILLECDEAQDVLEQKWAKDFEPMAASTNATTVFTGTAWTSQTFLAQTIAYLERQQKKDGVRRVFRYDAEIVGAEVPAYRLFVAKRVAKLGRNHPLIKTQYYLEDIDASGGMFPPQRQALMRGDHERQHEPTPGHRYALLIDVAGEDEAEGDPQERAMLANPQRDATALTVVDVDYEYGQLPTYRTVDRKLWLGIKHTTLYQELLALARHWHAVWVVVDATGVGTGLASFLAKALGGHRDKTGLTQGPVIPVVFSSKVKSDLGWNFLGIVETGRYRDYSADDAQDTRQFWYEVGSCQREVRPGPNRLLKWGVWDDVAYDGLIAYGHDDLLISAALTAVLDEQDWPASAEGASVEVGDVLEEIDDALW